MRSGLVGIKLHSLPLVMALLLLPLLFMPVAAGAQDTDAGREDEYISCIPLQPLPCLIPFQVGKVEIEGSFSAEDVLGIVRRHWNELKYCYDRERGDGWNLAGEVVLDFQINAQGLVEKVSILRSGLGRVKAEKCMLDVASRWMFWSPDGQGPGRATVPLYFRVKPRDENK